MNHFTKYTALLITCAAIASSCATSKQVRQSLHETTAETVQSDVRIEAKQTTESVSQTDTQGSKSESEEGRTIDLQFDTTQPVDPATGTPPLKSAKITDRKKNSQNDTRQQTTTATKQQTDIEAQDSSNMNAQKETDFREETEKKNQSLIWPWLLVVAALIGIGWWLWKRWGWRI